MSASSQSVAIVDDEESVGRAIRRLLKSANIDAVAFASGEAFLDALHAADPYRPACVILDFQMPGMSGIDVQQRLAGTGLPVIVITAHDEPNVRAQAHAGGALAYLCKPFDELDLIDAVRSVLDRDRDA
ncbi:MULTISPECIES: response regulator transcription factor [Paraburkholderia]|uniref:Response regulator receiver domain-containing protein n=1 Tax=Paraburkholderia tropica TaxID=92647 RepID=A0A1A5X6M4_9BURK|nr:response regulator [Paraburkholderia tropica]MBB2979747.1 FixJ family two-component response regulator [Paraburkholderia tropica]MDE1143774.1 response regulator [Paraburkholderia tropica]OBR49077.1 histidine kinase [Paraburkholderia tropica]PXX16989.1 response regulator receiver domain-containing protein [Paraburkholderia tropica]PZW83868.1 response regulator receiver domain-containing protein [Paraburkholderia tropica]